MTADQLDLDGLEAKLAAATPGPWVSTDQSPDGGAYMDPPRGVVVSDGAPWVGRTTAVANADAIVALRNAAPELLRLARRGVELEAAVLALADTLEVSFRRLPEDAGATMAAARLRATVAAVTGDWLVAQGRKLGAR